VKKHTKIYIKYFNYVLDDFIPCEVCGSRAVDIHHIENRGSGGAKNKDRIENLMAVCRSCHLEYGDVPEKVEWLKQIHERRL
tara:strand:+ start:849 stop:1094 length:246 start_codon:yes stop_codon:yes gene_type:complete